jgi:Domain of unknown function (DUF5753)
MSSRAPAATCLPGVVLDQTVLRRPMGGHKVMHAQLEHLFRAAEQPGTGSAAAGRPGRPNSVAKTAQRGTMMPWVTHNLPDPWQPVPAFLAWRWD